MPLASAHSPYLAEIAPPDSTEEIGHLSDAHAVPAAYLGVVPATSGEDARTRSGKDEEV